MESESATATKSPVADVTTSEPAEPSTCKTFLDKLPAEIRNTIYELSFTPDHNSDTEVDLFKGSPPSKALLITCRQAYFEAEKIYQHSYCEYSTNTKFFCDHDKRVPFDEAPFRAAMDALRNDDLDHISSIVVRWHGNFPPTIDFELIDPRGGWLISGEFATYAMAMPDTRGQGWILRGMRSKREMDASLGEATSTPTIKEQISLHFF